MQGGSIVKYEWDFNGDGIYDWNADSGIATFKFNNEGVYTSTLRVTDENGHNATDSMIVAVGTEIPVVVPDPTPNNSTSNGDDDGGELSPMLLAIGAIALVGAGGAAYYFSRDTTDYSSMNTSPVEEKKTEPVKKKVVKSFVPNTELISIECPGCQAQMKVPKLGKSQEVTCKECGLSGEIEI